MAVPVTVQTWNQSTDREQAPWSVSTRWQRTSPGVEPLLGKDPELGCDDRLFVFGISE
jgi:hypothetical protein